MGLWLTGDGGNVPIGLTFNWGTESRGCGIARPFGDKSGVIDLRTGVSIRCVILTGER